MYESAFEIQLHVLVGTDHFRGWPAHPCPLQRISEQALCALACGAGQGGGISIDQGPCVLHNWRVCGEATTPTTHCGRDASELQHDGNSFILHKLEITLCMLAYMFVKVFVKAWFQFYLFSFLLNSWTRFCLTSCIPASKNNPDRQFQCFPGWIPESIIPQPEKNSKFWHHISICSVSSQGVTQSRAWYKGQASNYPKEQRMIKMDSPSLHTRIRLLGLGLGGLKLMLHSLSWSPFALLWKKTKLN